jgi:hypothetical protein
MTYGGYRASMNSYSGPAGAGFRGPSASLTGPDGQQVRANAQPEHAQLHTPDRESFLTSRMALSRQQADNRANAHQPHAQSHTNAGDSLLTSRMNLPHQQAQNRANAQQNHAQPHNPAIESLLTSKMALSHQQARDRANAQQSNAQPHINHGTNVPPHTSSELMNVDNNNTGPLVSGAIHPQAIPFLHELILFHTY